MSGINSRRSFVTAAVAAGFGIAGSARAWHSNSGIGMRLRPSADFEILCFCAAMKAIYADMWSQVAQHLPSTQYATGLQTIDPGLPQQIAEGAREQHNHATLLKSLLKGVGGGPIDLEQFRTLSEGTPWARSQQPRLTTLTNLNLEASYFSKFQSIQESASSSTATLTFLHGFSAVPMTRSVHTLQALHQAETAIVHLLFATQHESGSYLALVKRITDPELLETFHYLSSAAFARCSALQSSLARMLAAIARRGEVATRLGAFAQDMKAIEGVRRATAPLAKSALFTFQILAGTNIFQGQPAEFFAIMQAVARAADRTSSEAVLAFPEFPGR